MRFLVPLSPLPTFLPPPLTMPALVIFILGPVFPLRGRSTAFPLFLEAKYVSIKLSATELPILEELKRDEDK